jgi:putative transport protein
MMKLSTMNTLGSLCGGMTSTPALGTLISVASSDAVASAYAATYPIALIVIVLQTQTIAIFCGL